MQKSSSYLFANLGKKWKNPTLFACFFVLSGQNLLPPLEIVGRVAPAVQLLEAAHLLHAGADGCRIAPFGGPLHLRKGRQALAGQGAEYVQDADLLLAEDAVYRRLVKTARYTLNSYLFHIF